METASPIACSVTFCTFLSILISDRLFLALIEGTVPLSTATVQYLAESFCQCKGEIRWDKDFFPNLTCDHFCSSPEGILFVFHNFGQSGFCPCHNSGNRFMGGAPRLHL